MVREESRQSEQEAAALHGLCCGPVESQPGHDEEDSAKAEEAVRPPFYLPCD